MTGLTHIEAVFIETDPYASNYDHGAVDNDYTNLPPEFLTALANLNNQRDNVRCVRCGTITGYVLTLFGDFERIAWQPTGLVREVGGPVVVQCGECAPFVPDPVG